MFRYVSVAVHIARMATGSCGPNITGAKGVECGAHFEACQRPPCMRGRQPPAPAPQPNPPVSDLSQTATRRRQAVEASTLDRHAGTCRRPPNPRRHVFLSVSACPFSVGKTSMMPSHGPHVRKPRIQEPISLNGPFLNYVCKAPTAPLFACNLHAPDVCRGGLQH